MLESTEKGGVRNSIHNCLTVFQYDPILSGAVAKNLLTERIDLLKPIGRKHRTGSKAMTDTDMKYIRLYLEKTYGLTSEKKIADAADLAADANSYHPIRDYLNGLVWDGKERIRYCLRHFLGADTDNYTFQSLRLFLLGAIHRAFCPGCKFEVMLCLVGGQGAGKSTNTESRFYLLVKKILLITINILNLLLRLFKYLVILIILNVLEMVLKTDVVLFNILQK